MSAGEPSPLERPRWLEWGAVLAILVLGVGLRLWHLGEGALFIDEAESSINALTILERGYPADTYLGLPLFENTLTEPWPEHPEYEFRDTSYSSRGMAIYHGWLPLYAIAASLALHGIGPDALSTPPRVQHDSAAIHTRILAARLPSVWFGALFLLAMFLAGRALYGSDAGLCAMLAAALAPRCIWLAQQARYYSASLALGTLAAFCLWQLHRRGRWRDFLLAGLVFVLLFHTSSLTFALLGLASLPLLPGILRPEGAGVKAAVASAIVTLGLLPWMLWSGYFEHGGRIPMARELLAFPADYFVYLRERQGRLFAGLGLLALFAAVLGLGRRLPVRWSAPFARARLPVVFLAWWSVVGYFGFQFLAPAVSCSMARLSHALIAPPLLLGALGLAALARALVPAAPGVLALGATLALLAGTDNLLRRQERNLHEAEAVFEVVEHLRGLELDADTRLYALPYQHFCLTYYTGLPVQSIAPVRREFLEHHPGEVLLLETAARVPPPPVESVARLARAQGVELGTDEARRWAERLHGRMVQAEVLPLVRSFRPDPEPLPEWCAPVLAGLADEAERTGLGKNDYALDNPALFRGLPPMTIAEFWPAFFYAFAGPEGRRGAQLNYAGRMREAEAHLLPSRWLVLRCPPRAPGPASSPEETWQ